VGCFPFLPLRGGVRGGVSCYTIPMWQKIVFYLILCVYLILQRFLPLSIVMERGSGGEVCTCTSDYLNCDHFATRAESQACLNYCLITTGSDTHRLDTDHDNLACESLP
jgi:hypothetical protein